MIEEIKVRKKKLKLKTEEKDYIEKIATMLNKDPREIQEVFLALVTCITMDLYSENNFFHIPYLFKVTTSADKKVIPKGWDIKPKFDIETSVAFKDIFEKIHTKESSWIEDFLKFQLYKELEKRINA